MTVWLIRICHHQVQGHGQQHLGEPPPCAAAVFEQFMERVLQFVIRLLLSCRQAERHRDLLVLRQFLAHVHERQEHAVFQQEPAVHQWGYARALALALFALDAAPVGVIPAFGKLVCCLTHAVFARELRWAPIGLSVLLHTLRAHAVQQIEDAGGIAVDEGGRHADALACSAEQLAHGVSLSAVCGVLMQLICQQAVYLPAVLPFDIGAEREAAAGAAHDGMAARVLDQLGELLFCRCGFAGVHSEMRKPAVYIAQMADAHPFALGFRSRGCPEDSAAAFALAVAAGLCAEILRCSVYQRLLAAVQKFHLDDAAAVRAGKALTACVPMDCRAAHITVSGVFLGQHRENRALTAGILCIEPIKVLWRPHDSGERVRYGLMQLAHPFARHVGGAEHKVQAFPMLLLEIRLKGQTADLALARPAFRDKQAELGCLQPSA